MLDSRKEEIIKDMVYKNYSTKYIGEYFGVSQRTAQKWLKKLGLNRTLSEAAEIKNINNKKPKSINKIKDKCDFKKNKFRKIDGEYSLYRFLDCKGKVLYVGKCEKSIHSNGRGGYKKYFIKDRITAHFSNSCKHLPKIAYLSVSKIEYSLCKTKDEMLSLEKDLILFYKMNNQCVWNGQMPLKFNNKYNFLMINWKKYHEFKRTL